MDESGNDGESAFFVLGGYILPADRWMDFSHEWGQVLAAKPEISYFHAADAEYGNGAFSGISQPFRRMKVLELLSVIEKYCPIGLVSWISFQDWKKHLLPHVRLGFEDTYYPLFDWVIKEVWQYQLVRGIFECSISFVFDDNTNLNLKSNLVRIHGAICQDASDPKLSHMLGASPEFEDDKVAVPLQAADLLVWHKRRELNFPEEDREIYDRVAATVHFSQALQAEYLRSFTS